MAISHVRVGCLAIHTQFHNPEIFMRDAPE